VEQDAQGGIARAGAWALSGECKTRRLGGGLRSWEVVRGVGEWGGGGGGCGGGGRGGGPRVRNGACAG